MIILLFNFLVSKRFQRSCATQMFYVIYCNINNFSISIRISLVTKYTKVYEISLLWYSFSKVLCEFQDSRASLEKHQSNCFTFFRNFWNYSAVREMHHPHRIYRSTLKCNMHDDGIPLLSGSSGHSFLSFIFIIFIANIISIGSYPVYYSVNVNNWTDLKVNKDFNYI